MIKFKRQSISKLSEKSGLNYVVFDILKQTSLEELVRNANVLQASADEFKTIILNNTKALLDLMIEEVENEKGN